MLNKKIISSLFITAFAVIFFSCGNKKDPVKIADEHNEAKFHNNDEENNSRFIVDAAQLLLQDIELAKMAQNNSIKKDVRKTGQQLELEYTQAYSLLKKLAEKKTITLPVEVSESNRKTNKDLSYEIADKFDDRYFELTKKDHADAIAVLEKIKIKCEHSDIQSWADNTLLIYRKNSGDLAALQQRLELNKPKP